MSGEEGRPEGEWVPAFEGQRPPFEPGNQVARKHGAWSVVAHSEEQRQVLAEAAALNPGWLTGVERFEAEAWSYAEGRCRLFRAVLAELPPMREDGKPWSAEKELQTWTRIAGQHRDRLGFNPLARARLGKDVAQTGRDLAALGQQGAELVRRFGGGDA